MTAETEVSSLEQGKKSKKNKEKKQISTKESTTTELKCNVCGESFPSKNKLFQHVKEKGHAIAVKLSDEEAKIILEKESKKSKRSKSKKK
jgi:DnaJ family protein A protein 5